MLGIACMQRGHTWNCLYAAVSSLMYIDCYCIISHNQLDMYTTVHVFTIETPNCLCNNVLFHTIQFRQT